MKKLLITIAAVVLVGCGQSVPDIDIINLAASTGDIEAIKQYLDAGGDVNAKNKVTTTPLYWAAYEGQKEIVELLIAKGADVNAKDDDGDTPLDYAHRLNIPKSLHSSANTAARGVKS